MTPGDVPCSLTQLAAGLLRAPTSGLKAPSLVTPRRTRVPRVCSSWELRPPEAASASRPDDGRQRRKQRSCAHGSGTVLGPGRRARDTGGGCGGSTRTGGSHPARARVPARGHWSHVPQGPKQVCRKRLSPTRGREAFGSRAPRQQTRMGCEGRPPGGGKAGGDRRGALAMLRARTATRGCLSDVMCHL